jgi:capsular polysaccharide transport system permease protein
MRTRFGRGYITYLIAIAWPLAHMGFITIAYLLKTQIAPVGDSPAVFIGTGVVPYIVCLYPARIMAYAVIQNKQLLNIPVIQPFHLMVSRCILEMLNAVFALTIFALCLYTLDVEIIPDNFGEAALAVAAAIYLGVGLGFLNVLMCSLCGPYFLVLFVFVMIILYLFSGVYIPMSAMPETVREYAIYNPLLNVVEWLRSAYYASYDSDAINKLLVTGVATICLVLGLLGERFLRGKFLG